MRGILQEPLEGRDKVRCNVCAFRCELSPGQVGMCRVRRNEGGEIEYLNEDNLLGGMCAHWEGCGAGLYCITGAKGCNWSCSFCTSASKTNPEYVQIKDGWRSIPLTSDGFMDRKALRGPKLTVFPFNHPDAERRFGTAVDYSTGLELIVKNWQESGRKGIGVRDIEPSIHVEQVLEILRGVHEEDGFTFINTNGYWTPELLEVLAPHVDVVNVGVKGSANKRFLRKVAGVPKTEPIFETIAGLVRHGCFVTVTDLPVYSESWEHDFTRLCRFVADTIPDRDYPRLTISPLNGRAAEAALGEFSLGLPHEDPWLDPDRVGLLIRATEIALDILGNVLVQHFGGVSIEEEGRFRDEVRAKDWHMEHAGEAEIITPEPAPSESVA